MYRTLVISTVCSAVLVALAGSGCGWAPGPGAGPQLAEYSNSGCLPGTGEAGQDTLAAQADTPNDYPGCDEDTIEVTVDGSSLTLIHRSATYNCCPDDIVVNLSADGDILTVTEEEDLSSGGCFCLCCYDVEATAVALDPGEYTLEYCWEDYETDDQECRVKDIVVP